MTDDPKRETDIRSELTRTESRPLVREPIGASTWVPVAAVVALLIALGVYFFSYFSMSTPHMRADANPVTTSALSPK
jgi:hypothetical protein